MNPQSISLALLAFILLLSDGWQDLRNFPAVFDAPLALAVLSRTALLVVTIAALLKPSRPLVMLALIGLILALVRRGLFLAPALDAASWPLFHSGLDLGFRLIFLGWCLHWLRSR